MRALPTMIFAIAVTAATLASPFASAHASLKSSNPEAAVFSAAILTAQQPPTAM